MPISMCRDDDISAGGLLANPADQCQINKWHITGGNKDPLLTGGTQPGMDSGQGTLPLKNVLDLSARDIRIKARRVGDNDDLFEQFRKSPVDMVDKACLLYTSPSPRDRTRSRM